LRKLAEGLTAGVLATFVAVTDSQRYDEIPLLPKATVAAWGNPCEMPAGAFDSHSKSVEEKLARFEESFE
jgi:hypothetical protein